MNKISAWALIEAITFAVVAPGFSATLPNTTLTYCSEASPAGFDPSQHTTTVEYTASAATLYNRLVEWNTTGTVIEPSLAKSWDISQDGRVYTFYLRQGVKFHTTPWFRPTRAFNAEDVVFTFERVCNPKMPFRRAYLTEFPNLEGHGFSKIITKIEALDPYTVRFTLKSANAPFLANLATPPASILSAEYATQLLKSGNPSEINHQPIGTGPFIFYQYVKDSTIRFDGNPDYWRPEDVQLSKLIFSITPDAAVRRAKLEANECQVSVSLRPADIAALRLNAHLQILSHTGLNLGFLAYNVTHKPLDDVRVRRALDMAINKKAIIKVVYQDHAQIAVAPMPPLQWSYDKNLKDTPRDLEKSKKLLAQAGYPEGFTLSLWAMPVQRSYNPDPKLMAQMIQADWKKIGVIAKVVSYEWGEYIKRGREGEHDAMLIGGIGDTYDPNIWFANLSCSGNFSKWCYAPFEDLINQALHTASVTERTQLYLRAQKIFKREQPFTPIAYPVIYQPIHKNVTGFKINPLGFTSFAGVGLQKKD